MKPNLRTKVKAAILLGIPTAILVSLILTGNFNRSPQIKSLASATSGIDSLAHLPPLGTAIIGFVLIFIFLASALVLLIQTGLIESPFKELNDSSDESSDTKQ